MIRAATTAAILTMAGTGAQQAPAQATVEQPTGRYDIDGIGDLLKRTHGHRPTGGDITWAMRACGRTPDMRKA